MTTIIAVLFHFILIAGVMVADETPQAVKNGDESTQATSPSSQDGVIIGD